MIDDKAPPTPLPPAAQPPWPEHPAPHGATRADMPHPAVARTAARDRSSVVAALGATLIGGAIATAIGLLLVRPTLRGKQRRG